MTTLRGSRQVVSLSAILALVFFVGHAREAQSDILFNGKQPVEFGKGREITTVSIEWSDCLGKSHRTLSTPPYWFNSGNQCGGSPAAFGLTCPDNFDKPCKVTQDDLTRQYLPDVKNGDEVYFQVTRGKVSLESYTEHFKGRK